MDEDMGEAGGGGGDGERKNGLISVNNLNYVLEPDLSVAVNATHKDQAFQVTSLTVQSAPVRSICLLNTGADFIDMFHSFLTFDLDIVAVNKAGGTLADFPSAVTFGSGGSALNLISRLTVASRSGDELVRINQLNQWAAQEMPFKYDPHWYESVGSGFYANSAGTSVPQCLTQAQAGCVKDDGTRFSTALPGDYANYIIPLVQPTLVATTQTTTTVRIAIPAYCLCGLFEYGRLLPSMLCSGLRIEIEWENKDRAFRIVSGNPAIVALNETNISRLVSYTVRNPSFRLKSIQLTDSLQRTLNEQSAVNGLEIVFPDYETTTGVIPPGGTGINIEVRKACSRALRATSRFRTVSTSPVDHLTDSFQSNLLDAGQPNAYQWQLGSLYFPHQQLDATSDAYAYEWNMSQFQCIQPGMVNTVWPSVNRKNFSGVSVVSDGKVPSLQTTYIGQGTDNTVCVCLERSSLFNLSGMPINNSRVLALTYRSGNTPNTVAEQTVVTMFLKYVKLARVFLLNIEVEQ